MAKKSTDYQQKQIDSFEKTMGLRFDNNNEQATQLNFQLFCSVAVVSKAFGNIDIHAGKTNVFINIELRWYGKFKFLKFFEWQRNLWMKESINNCKEFLPEGYGIFIFYKKDGNGKYK